MRVRSVLMAMAAAAHLGACGGGDDGGDAGDGTDDGADGADAGPGSECGFTSTDYLPYEPGYSWTYQLTDLDDGARAVKEQRIDPGMDHPDYGPVVVQVTGKINGSTVSLVRKEDGRVLRFQQEDRDASGALERTTIYEPPQVRIDETEEHTQLGAEWDEAYTEIELAPDGVEISRIDTIDHIEILAVDEGCDTPIAAFSCLRFRRTRVAGGVAEKEFQFARGIGKIREVGSNQLEELVDCGLAE